MKLKSTLFFLTIFFVIGFVSLSCEEEVKEPPYPCLMLNDSYYSNSVYTSCHGDTVLALHQYFTPTESGQFVIHFGTWEAKDRTPKLQIMWKGQELPDDYEGTVDLFVAQGNQLALGSRYLARVQESIDGPWFDEDATITVDVDESSQTISVILKGNTLFGSQTYVEYVANEIPYDLYIKNY